MIQRKKKQVKIILLILIIIAAIVAGTWGILNSINGKKEPVTDIKKESLSQFETKSLIVETKLAEAEVQGKFQASQIEVLMEGEENETTLYLLRYNTEQDTKEAYEKLKADTKIENVDLNRDIELNAEINKVYENSKKIKLTNEIGQVFKWLVGDVELTSWGPYAMGLDETQTKINSKENNPEIIVAVIDSGIQLKNSALMSDGMKGRILEGYDATGKSDITDADGHGTNVAGIILESTPNNVKIMPIKALETDENGKTTGNSAYLITAINYAIKKGADIINMSLGSDQSNIIEIRAIDRAYEKGITSIVASGNGDEKGNALNLDLPKNNCYPAEYDNVITVGAVRNKLISIASTSQLSGDFSQLLNGHAEYIKAMPENLTIAQFSNYGSCIDFVAPGVLIVGLTRGEGSAVGSYDGTSQATPHVSAAAATIKSYNKDYTSDQIEEILKYYAKDLGDEGKDIIYGNGIVSFKEFSECECGTENCEKIYCFGCDNDECIFHKGKTKKLTNIEITKAPDKIIYNEGEKFDPTGMIVTAVYSDNTKKPIEEYTYSENIGIVNWDEDEIECKETIDIEYTEDDVTRHAKQEITIKRDVEAKAKLTSIEITTPPNSIYYEAVDGAVPFDKTGMVVTAKYDDNTSKIVENYTCDPNEITPSIFKNQVNGEYVAEVTISYTEGEITKTAVQEIKLKEAGGGGDEEEAKLSGLKITTPPTKTNYEVGETFDKSGMVVTATYSDGTEKLVNGYTIDPTRTLTINDSKVTISYTEKGVTKKVDQKITVKAKATGGTEEPPSTQDPTKQEPEQKKVLEKITATKRPNKTSYKVGEKVDIAGLIITASYADGSNKTITNYTYSPTGELKETDTEIKVSYEEDGVKKTMSIPIIVQKASQQNANTDTDDDFDGPGLGSSMFDVTDGDGKKVTISQDDNGEGGQKVTIKDDGTKSGGELAYTGLEDNIIPIGVGVTVIILAVSYIACKKYKDI